MVALRSIIKNFRNKKILVWGDLILDHYIHGYANRISREAPIPILKFEWERYELGGAANTAKNLASLGVRTTAVGIVGQDREGEKLLSLLREKEIEDKVLREGKTLRKMRILAGGEFTKKQQVARIDWGENFSGEELGKITDKIGDYDGIIISDYGYGTACPNLLNKIKSHSKIIIVDSRKGLREFRGVTSATPNIPETEDLLEKPLLSMDEIFSNGKFLREKLNLESLLITLGNRGLVLIQKDKEPVHIEAFGGRNIVDVTGAGDTVAAVFTLSLASGADFLSAAVLANIAGGLSVMKEGAASITKEELVKGVKDWESFYQDRKL